MSAEREERGGAVPVADSDELRSADAEAVERFYGSVTVGDRGQVVIPAALRRDCGIRPGDRLLAFRGGPGEGGLFLARIDTFHRMLSEHLAQVEGELRRPAADIVDSDGDEGISQDGGGEA